MQGRDAIHPCLHAPLVDPSARGAVRTWSQHRLFMPLPLHDKTRNSAKSAKGTRPAGQHVNLPTYVSLKSRTRITQLCCWRVRCPPASSCAAAMGRAAASSSSRAAGTASASRLGPLLVMQANGMWHEGIEVARTSAVSGWAGASRDARSKAVPAYLDTMVVWVLEVLSLQRCSSGRDQDQTPVQPSPLLAWLVTWSQGPHATGDPR